MELLVAAAAEDLADEDDAEDLADAENLAEDLADVNMVVLARLTALKIPHLPRALIAKGVMTIQPHNLPNKKEDITGDAIV